MVACHNFVIKSRAILHLLNSANETCYHKILDGVLIQSISKKIQEQMKRWRGVDCHLLLVAVVPCHNFVTKSYPIIHVLTSAKGT